MPPISLPMWMNSDMTRPVAVKPNPAGYLGFPFIKHFDFFVFSSNFLSRALNSVVGLDLYSLT